MAWRVKQFNTIPPINALREGYVWWGCMSDYTYQKMTSESKEKGEHLEKIPRSWGSIAKEKQMYFSSLSLSFLNFYFIALSMLGTNIKLNICSIQTIKPLKKQTKNWNKTKTATVNIQDLFLLIKTFSDCFGVRISQPYIPSMLQPLTNFTGKKLWMKNKKQRIMFFSLKKKNST